jgi:hypothetical protein
LAACTACEIGTYTASKGAQTCVACPANSNNTMPRSGTRNDCVCSFGYVRSALDFTTPLSECLPCNPNYYCSPFYSTMVPCPAHTHSQALSSLPVHCRCDAGYRCRYVQEVSLRLTFPNTFDFPAQSASIRAALAGAASVPAESVRWTVKQVG